MPDLREWAREGRVIVVLSDGTREVGVSDLEGLLAVDFLLQHPSVLERFARLSHRPWAPLMLPSEQEAQSSEETLLRWKRAVSGEILVPILRRLIGQDLLKRERNLLTLHRQGFKVAERLAQRMAPGPRDRAAFVTAEFRIDPDAARLSLREALAGGSG